MNMYIISVNNCAEKKWRDIDVDGLKSLLRKRVQNLRQNYCDSSEFPISDCQTTAKEIYRQLLEVNSDRVT